MALRLLLVGLVALMSFELPGPRDLEAWVEGSSHWAEARVADLSEWKDGAAKAFSRWSPSESLIAAELPVDRVAEEVALIRADVVFEAAMENLVADFRTDLASTEATLPVAEEAPVLIASEKAIEPAESIVEPLKLIPSPEQADKLEKLSSAVKLTRQAISAWASLIPQTAESEPSSTF